MDAAHSPIQDAAPLIAEISTVTTMHVVAHRRHVATMRNGRGLVSSTYNMSHSAEPAKRKARQQQQSMWITSSRTKET